MGRPLVPGLVAEGRTDEAFLGPLIYRQLGTLLAARHGGEIDLAQTQVGGCHTIRDFRSVVSAVADLIDDCHVVFVHNDHNERDKAVRVVEHLEVVTRSAAVLPVVPVRETEAWLLADRSVWRRLRGGRADVLPSRPRDVERVSDPKSMLDQALPVRSGSRLQFFEYVGNRIELAALSSVPAYRRWLADTERALKGLGYL